jgi:hypothetical protein
MKHPNFRIPARVQRELLNPAVPGDKIWPTSQGPGLTAQAPRLTPQPPDIKRINADSIPIILI